MSTNGAPDVLRQILATDVNEDALRALSTRQQRYVLYHLLDEERATLSELADVLAGWMAASENGVTTGVERSSLRMRLYHVYLPKLADAGLLAFDPEEKVVDRSPLSTDERELIEAAFLAEHWTSEPATQECP